MKKIIYFICIMLFGFSIKASPIVDYQEGIYSNRIGDKLYSGKMAFIFLNDNIVYCLDPFEIVGKTYYEDTNYLNNMNRDNLKYFELVAYYGYNKTNRNSIYYYMAAQELIWERIIGGGKIFWSTGENDTGSRIDVSGYKNEIINDINNFNTLPSFHNETVKYDYFVNKIFTDKNKVINNYNYEIKGNSIIKKGNNTLSIKMLDHSKTKIELFRTIKTNNNTIIYTGIGNQTLGSFGINMTKKSDFYIEPNPYKSNVKISFYDKETKELLRDVKFKLCTNEELENINGKYIGVLYEGKYSICELNNKYESESLLFEIKKEDLIEYTNIDFYLTKKEIKKELSLGNTYVPNEILFEPKENKKEISIEELPSTYDYNFIKYSVIISILIGSVIYKVSK